MFNTKSLDKLGFKNNKLIIENITFLLKKEDLHIIDENKNTVIIKQVTNKNLEKIINNYFDNLDDDGDFDFLLTKLERNLINIRKSEIKQVNNVFYTYLSKNKNIHKFIHLVKDELMYEIALKKDTVSNRGEILRFVYEQSKTNPLFDDISIHFIDKNLKN